MQWLLGPQFGDQIIDGTRWRDLGPDFREPDEIHP
jgi:hypothetical protein